MATPHHGELVVDAAAEAAQAVEVSVRLMLALADAVRRQAEKRAGRATEPPPGRSAMAEAAGELHANRFPPALAAALMGAEDWPRTAQQLVALKRAGVRMDEFLPRVGELAGSVHAQVLADRARTAAEGAEPWAALLRETMPAGPVREAILASPDWPELAAQMRAAQERGVDVRRLLVAAREEGVGVDRAVARVTGAAGRPVVPTSPDVNRLSGPLTAGLDAPRDLDLDRRPEALAKLGVTPAGNAQYVRWLQEALPGHEREAALLVKDRRWPLLAARMARTADAGRSVPDQLERLTRRREDWDKGPVAELADRLVVATHEALTRPPGSELTGPRASAGAARAKSVTVQPARTAKPVGRRPAAERTAAAHAVAARHAAARRR